MEPQTPTAYILVSYMFAGQKIVGWLNLKR